MEKVRKTKPCFTLKYKLIYNFNQWYCSSLFCRGKGLQPFFTYLALITIKLKPWAVLENVGVANTEMEKNWKNCSFHSNSHCPKWEEEQKKCTIWPLFTDFALLSHCTQTCWTRVFSLSVVPTGLWMNPPASVSVKTDSPKTAAVLAGNWTIKPVSKSSDVTYTIYLKFLWRSDLTLREFMKPPVCNTSDMKTEKCGWEYLIRSLCFHQVNASVKVKETVCCVLLGSGGMQSCVDVYVLYNVHGISPSTLTPARVSAERVHSRVCVRARSSTTTLAGRCTGWPRPSQRVWRQSCKLCHFIWQLTTEATLSWFHFLNCLTKSCLFKNVNFKMT